MKREDAVKAYLLVVGVPLHFIYSSEKRDLQILLLSAKV